MQTCSFRYKLVPVHIHTYPYFIYIYTFFTQWQNVLFPITGQNWLCGGPSLTRGTVCEPRLTFDWKHEHLTLRQTNNGGKTDTQHVPHTTTCHQGHGHPWVPEAVSTCLPRAFVLTLATGVTSNMLHVTCAMLLLLLQLQHGCQRVCSFGVVLLPFPTCRPLRDIRWHQTVSGDSLAVCSPLSRIYQRVSMHASTHASVLLYSVAMIELGEHIHMREKRKI